MPKIIPVVEGDGEVKAVPALLYKLLADRSDVFIGEVVNAGGKPKLLSQFEKFIQHAENKLRVKPEPSGGILILLDTDDSENGCPYQLARLLAARVSSNYPVAVVCANQDYEAWLLPFIDRIAGQDINGRVLLKAGLRFDGEAEGTKGKGWIKRHVAGDDRYSEPEDQFALTRFIDIDHAALRAMRSFQRLRHAVEELIAAIDSGQSFVTPTSQR